MLEYSIYYPGKLLLPAGKYQGFNQITAEQYRLELQNMLAHGLGNPNIYWALEKRKDGKLDFERLEKVLQLRASVGMRPGALYLIHHPVLFVDRPLKPQERQRTHQDVREINAWAQARGYDEVFFHALDEFWGDALSGERDSMLAVREAGGHVFVAVKSPTSFGRVGDVLARAVLLAPFRQHDRSKAKLYSPQESLRHMPEIVKADSLGRMRRNQEFRKAIDGAHRLGHKIFTYMNPPAGYPALLLQRRHEGLGCGASALTAQ